MIGNRNTVILGVVAGLDCDSGFDVRINELDPFGLGDEDALTRCHDPVRPVSPAIKSGGLVQVDLHSLVLLYHLGIRLSPRGVYTMRPIALSLAALTLLALATAPPAQARGFRGGFARPRAVIVQQRVASL
jgi:hypothetical protein